MPIIELTSFDYLLRYSKYNFSCWHNNFSNHEKMVESNLHNTNYMKNDMFPVAFYNTYASKGRVNRS